MSTDNYEGFRSSYRWLIRLPKTLHLVVFAVIMAAFSLALSWIMHISTLELTKSLVYALFPPVFLYLVNRRVFNFRRSLSVFLIYLVFLPIVILLGKSPVYGAVFEVLLGLLLAVAVYSVHLGALYSALNLVLICFLGFDTKLLYATLIFYVFSLIIFTIIDSRIRRIAGVSSLGFLEAFLRYILSGDHIDVEKYLEKISTERTLPIHIYSFHSRGQEIGRLVVSNVHPGPLRTLGSSTLPQLVKQCSKIPVLFLKAPVAHSENLATVEATSRVANAICGAQAQPRASSGWAGEYTTSLLRITVLGFGDIPRLAFLDPIVIMEDLPYRVSELSLEELGTVTVDNHNMIADGFLKIENEQEDEIAKIIAAVRTATENKTTEGKIQAGFSSIDYTDNITIGPAGIACAAISTGGKKFLVASFDGNNMEPDFKARLVSRLDNMADTAIVTTTDTHIYTGLYQGRDYYPVGSVNPEQVLEKAVKCAQDALASLQEAEVGYTVLPVRDKFMDGEKLDKISVATRKNTRDGLLLVFLALAISVLLLLF
uniref:DUF2070 family protein n=1 Tax=Thermofilum adornatum TaxID=1365176 RepID=A0A7C1CD39_9CREN